MKEKLLRTIIDDFGADARLVKYDTSLFKDKLLDSMNLTFLIAFIEEEFGIKVSAMDVVFENFDSIDNIALFIERKKNF